MPNLYKLKRKTNCFTWPMSMSLSLDFFCSRCIQLFLYIASLCSKAPYHEPTHKDENMSRAQPRQLAAALWHAAAAALGHAVLGHAVSR